MPRCITCKKDLKNLGMPRHRAMHKDKREDCIIRYANGEIYKFYYSRLKP